MSNRGFTLVELIGVVIILAIIAALVFPVVSSVIKRATTTVYDAQINTILSAAYDYSLTHTSILPSSGETNYITLAELKQKGLIDTNIVNPTTKKQFEDNLTISISYINSKYEGEDEYFKIKGKYLYKIELNNNPELLPTIVLNGYPNNSGYNYVQTLNLSDNFVEPEYLARSYNNIDITDRVAKYITFNGSDVDEVDTSISGIYKINYAVVDEEGNSNFTTLNLIIGDTSAPTIYLPSNNTISTNINNFDLLNGVRCEDNSGFCDITYVDTIEYGVPGKYIIEYAAIDPTGNTKVSRRVITVE